MVYFFKKLFKIECYRFIGRGGLFYFDGENEYYVDTQNYVPNKLSREGYAVTIMTKGIRDSASSDKVVDKVYITSRVKSILNKQNIVVEIY
ncbi:MAG: hypothetical protein WBO44_03045 [Saprospiraceae bacterium]